MALRRASRPENVSAYAAAMDPLLAAAVAEHRQLAAAAGAWGFFRETGMAAALPQRARLRRFGGARAICPAIRCRLSGLVAGRGDDARASPRTAFRARRSLAGRARSVSSPGGVTKAYAERFVAEGGRIFTGDATKLRNDNKSWTIDTTDGFVVAPVAVVALGPWSMDVLRTARLPPAFCGQARLSPALPGRGQCRPHEAGGRYRERLRHHADGTRNAGDHGS